MCVCVCECASIHGMTHKPSINHYHRDLLECSVIGNIVQAVGSRTASYDRRVRHPLCTLHLHRVLKDRLQLLFIHTGSGCFHSLGIRDCLPSQTMGIRDCLPSQTMGLETACLVRLWGLETACLVRLWD